MTKGLCAMSSLLVVLYTTLLPAVPANAEEQSVLELLPADTHFVLMAPNMDRLNKQMGSQAKKMGLPAKDFAAEMIDMVGQLGLNVDQLNRDGTIAVVVPKFGDMETIQSDFVVILPVKDGQKFLADNKAVSTEGGLASIKSDAGTFTVKQLGNYVVCGSNDKLVASLGKPAKSLAAVLTAEHLDLLKSADIAMHADPKGMVDAVMMVAEMQPQAGQVAGVLKALGKQVASYDVAIRFVADGVEADVMALSIEGSDLGKYCATAVMTDKPIITGIGSTGLIVGIGALSNPNADVKLLRAAADPAEKEPTATATVIGVSGKQGDERVSLPLTFQMIRRYSDEATARQVAKQELDKPQPATGENAPERTTEKIGDVEVTRTTMPTEMFGPFSQFVQMFLGQELAMRQAVKGPAVLMMVGGDSKSFGRFLTAVGDNNALAVPGMDEVRKHLHARRAGEVFIMVRPIEDMIRAFLAAFTNQPAEPSVLPGTQIGVSWAFSKQSIDIRFFVPDSLLSGFQKLMSTPAVVAPPAAADPAEPVF